MRFEPGQTITRRYVRGPWHTWAQAMRVISDDDRGLLLWQPEGSEWARLVDADGNTPHEVAPDRMRDPELIVRTWDGNSVLILMPPGAAYSVWWFFEHDAFAGWYVNLETPFTRHDDAVETTDQVLDIVVDPDRTWKWKDTDEFELFTGHPLYFDAAGAAAIRAEGERLTGLIEAGAFPFDGTHTRYRPGPDWPRPRLRR
jgi:hypothetical protein